MAVLNRRDYYSAIPQLEKKFAEISKYITVEEGKLQIKIDDLYGNLASLTITTEEVESRVEDAEGDISTLTQRADGIDIAITTKADSSDVDALEGDLNSEVSARTMLIRAFSNSYGGGTITAYQGQSYGVFTNAMGSVDIVSLAWSGSTPRITGTSASFQGDGMRVYDAEGTAIASFTNNGVSLLSGKVLASYGLRTRDSESPLCVTTVYGTSTSVAGGNSSRPVTKSISKSGYLPIGIVGAKTGNGDVVFSRFDLTSISPTYGTATLTYNVRQVGGGSGTVYSVQPEFQILWMDYLG